MGQEDFEKKTLIELQQIGKEIGLKSITKFRKNELIEQIQCYKEQQKKTEQNSIIKNITTYGFEIKQDKQNELPIEQKEVVQQQKEVVQEQKEVQQEQKEKTLQSLENAPIGEGILEVMPDGYGFLRAENFLRGSGDIYISQSQIKRFNLKTGDAVRGNMRLARENEKYNALLYVKTVNGDSPQKAVNRPSF